MMTLPSEVEDLPPWIKIRIQAINNVTFQAHQRPKPKMFGKKEENGVSTPHVLSMRPYAHIRAIHAKKGHLVKICHFTLL